VVEIIPVSHHDSAADLNTEIYIFIHSNHVHSEF